MEGTWDQGYHPPPTMSTDACKTFPSQNEKELNLHNQAIEGKTGGARGYYPSPMPVNEVVKKMTTEGLNSEST